MMAGISFDQNMDKEMCRICLRRENLQSIFEFKITSDKTINLSQKLKVCCNVDVDINDKLPSHICEECSDGLILAYDLILLCQCTDELLRRDIKLEYEVPIEEKRTEYAVYFDSDYKNDPDYVNESVESLFNDESINSEMEDEEKIIAENFIDDVIFSSDDDDFRYKKKSRSKKRRRIKKHERIEKNKRIMKRKRSDVEEKSYKCYACELRFPSRWKRELHEDLECPKMPPGSLYECRICLATAENRREFDDHVWQEHKGTAPPREEEDYTKDIAPEKRKRIKTSGGVCEICGYFCETQSKYTAHRQIHEPKKVRQCPECPFNTTIRHSFNVHVRLAHKGGKPLQCRLCPYTTGFPENLTKHMKKHTGEKPFACEMCDYRSVNNTNLKTHMAKHNKNRDFRCKICTAAYTLKSSLRDHILKAHQNIKILRCKHGKCKYNTLKEELMDKHVEEKHGVDNINMDVEHLDDEISTAEPQVADECH